MLKRVRALLTAAAVAAPLVLVGGGSASASETAATASLGGSICHNQTWGGSFYCDSPGDPGSGEAWKEFSNRTWEVFVIGTDYHVWTRWSHTDGSLSPWTDMGGVASSYVTVLNGSDPYSGKFSIAIQGSRTWERWYRDREDPSGSWTKWHM